MLTDSSLHDMFLLALPWMEKLLRPLLVYAALVVLLRVFGKRELAQLNPFDLVVLLCLANTVQNAIIGNDNSVSGGLLGALALLSANWLTVRLLLRHRRLDQLVEGKPAVLVEHGHIHPRALAREMMSEAELAVAVHRQGLRLADVERCVLEPNGTFAIIPKAGRGDPHAAILTRLDSITAQLERIRGPQ